MIRLTLRRRTSVISKKAAAERDQPLGLFRIARNRVRVRARFIQRVDSTVRAMAIELMFIGERDGGADRLVGYDDVMVALEALAPRVQHVERLVRTQFAHDDALEAALERRIAADPSFVFIFGRRSDDAKVTAHERRFEHVGRVHGRA